MMNEQEVIDNLKQFVTISKIKFAKTFLQQSLGLMFRDCIPHDFGLWFEFKKPKKVVVHTFFMKFNIDVVFFGENQKVIKVVRNMQPWKFVKVEGVKEFLEVKGGTIV
ncbi:DUF192 domain-containing protein [candidate division WOR-3 bacterium]|nr:DUF192 domain-containing protein [candidate division WOR-3 bacterium]